MMQDPIIDDPLNPAHAIDFANIERQTAAEAWLQAHNKRVAAAAFDRSRMAKCWVPRTRKAHSRAAKAETSSRRFLAYFTIKHNLRIEMPVTASKEYNEANAVAVPV